MSRSLKKGPYVDEGILRKLDKAEKGSKEAIKVWNRSAVITPEMIGYAFGVHNGREHIKVLVAEEMVGHRLGEFAPTRKFIRHGGRMAREEESALRAAETGKTKAVEEKTEETAVPKPEEKKEK